MYVHISAEYRNLSLLRPEFHEEQAADESRLSYATTCQELTASFSSQMQILLSFWKCTDILSPECFSIIHSIFVYLMFKYSQPKREMADIILQTSRAGHIWKH